MNKLLKNFLSVLIGRIGGHGLTVFASIYLARVLHPEGYGVVGFLSSYTSFFMLIAALGIPVYGARELARINDPHEKARFTGLWMKTNLLFAFAAYLLFVGSLWLFHFDPVIKKFGIIWGLRLILSGASCYWVFQAHERMGIVGIRDFLKGSLFFGTIIAFIQRADQLLNVAWLSFGTVLLGELFLLILLFSGFLGFIPSRRTPVIENTGCEKIPPTPFTKGGTEVVTFFKGGAFWIGLTLLMAQVYYRTDSVIIELIKGAKFVGLYTAMYQLIFVGESIAVLYFTSILPRISTFWHNDREKLSNLLEFSMSIFVILGCLSGIVGLLFSKEIVYLVYGSGYVSSHRAFAILIWSMVMTCMALTPVYFLIGTQYQKECSHATVIAAVVNLILDFPLIIYYGINGAALATVASKVTEFVYVYKKANEKIVLGWKKDRILRLALALAIALGVGAVNHNYKVMGLLNVTAVCASYFAAILGLRVISIEKIKQSVKHIET